MQTVAREPLLIHIAQFYHKVGYALPAYERNVGDKAGWVSGDARAFSRQLKPTGPAQERLIP